MHQGEDGFHRRWNDDRDDAILGGNVPRNNIAAALVKMLLPNYVGLWGKRRYVRGEGLRSAGDGWVIVCCWRLRIMSLDLSRFVLYLQRILNHYEGRGVAVMGNGTRSASKDDSSLVYV